RYIQRWVKSSEALFDCLFSFIRSTKPQNQELWEELDSHMPSEYPLAVEMEANYDKDQLFAHCAFTSAFGSAEEAGNFLEKAEIILSDLARGEKLPLSSFGVDSASPSRSPVSVARWSEDSWSSMEIKLRDIVAQFCGLDTEKITKNSSFL